MQFLDPLKNTCIGGRGLVFLQVREDDHNKKLQILPLHHSPLQLLWFSLSQSIVEINLTLTCSHYPRKIQEKLSREFKSPSSAVVFFLITILFR